MKHNTHIFHNDGIEFNVNSLNENETYTIMDGSVSELESNIQRLVTPHFGKDIQIKYRYNNSQRRDRVYNTEPGLISKCIVFMKDDSKNCMIITDIDYNKYVFKQFTDPFGSIYVCRQKTGMYILTDPNVFIYSNTEDPISTLDILIYSTTKLNISINIESRLEHRDICVDEAVINYKYYNDVLYNKQFNHKFIDELISNGLYDETLYLISKGNVPKIREIGDVINELINLKVYSGNRFANRFIYKNIISESTCYWLINLLKLYHSDTSNVVMNLDEKHAFHDNLMVILIEYLLPFVSSSFNLDKENFTIKVISNYIIRETSSSISEMNDVSIPDVFSISILLSKLDASNDSHFKFKDGAIYKPEQGDAIVFYSDLKQDKYIHENPVYLLNIKFKIEPNKPKKNIL